MGARVCGGIRARLARDVAARPSTMEDPGVCKPDGRTAKRPGGREAAQS